MSTVKGLLAGYIDEHRRAGGADPLAYLERASPAQRGELAALIDSFLARAPRRRFDEAAFRDSRAEATVESLERSIDGAAGLWPTLLPRLRARAGLKRRELVERLAAALGVQARQEKVERYYHEMESGLLPAAGVSDRVLAALAKLVGSTAAELRDAGSTLGPVGDSPSVAVAFARTAYTDAVAEATAINSTTGDEEWDEVDELFRGGGG